ncbi:hypothetical protein LTSESEN_5245, partial [Salmonella enterica subsp. enterica serovar Senftenberg str. A4-543]
RLDKDPPAFIAKGYRLPEPTRWADAVASGRPAFVRWQEIQR